MCLPVCVLFPEHPNFLYFLVSFLYENPNPHKQVVFPAPGVLGSL